MSKSDADASTLLQGKPRAQAYDWCTLIDEMKRVLTHGCKPGNGRVNAVLDAVRTAAIPGFEWTDVVIAGMEATTQEFRRDIGKGRDSASKVGKLVRETMSP